MEIRSVHLTDKKVRQIYEDSFPKKERMPFILMVAMSKLWNTRFLSFYDGEEPVGFLYLAKNRKLVFLMLFAVKQELRGRGYGSLILKEIRKRYSSQTIIVSIEPCISESADFELCCRRKAFYLHNGFAESGWDMRLNRTNQEILTANGGFNKRQFIGFFAHYSNGTVWPRLRKRS